MKALQLITRSLRLLRVIDRAEAPEAEDAQAALMALNAMMRRWEANGIALGWNALSDVQEDLPIPPEAEEAIAYNLAVVLRPEYGATLDPDVIGLASGSLSALRRDVKVANPLQIDRGGGGYNIVADDYIGGLPVYTP